MKHLPIKKPESSFLPFDKNKERLQFELFKKSGIKQKAVFLDRDGTINIEPDAEQGYILDPKDIELIPMAGEAIRILNDAGILTIVITNQAAIDKRLLSLKQFETINDILWEVLSNKNAHYDALYYCPHSPNITHNCRCRKPKPGLILQAAVDFNIDLPSSFMIGDKLTDIEAGNASGCKTILVRSGLGEKSYNELVNYSEADPSFICNNLKEAVAWLLPKILDQR